MDNDGGEGEVGVGAGGRGGGGGCVASDEAAAAVPGRRRHRYRAPTCLLVPLDFIIIHNHTPRAVLLPYLVGGSPISMSLLSILF